VKILGIETSCDETAVSILEDNKIISEVIFSQIDIHSKYGGVVPEIASREHLKKINIILESCLHKANINIRDIDAVSVTSMPGLEGSLLVGLMVARTVSFMIKIPLVEVNHLESHLFASTFTDISSPPGLGLIISGGHTRLVHIKEWGNYEIIGKTRDDAVGECFDKVASILSLPYPGGPAIEKISREGNPEKFKFPVAKLGNSYDFSYSGIKTAVLYKIKYDFKGKISEEQKKDIAASFQYVAFKPLVENAIKAARELNVKWLFVCGGVAANGKLREIFRKKTENESFNVIFPEKKYCTDNASMVAACGQFYLSRQAKSYI
jgi:N6-L-threonylcarbamoyladenine synthase